MKSGGASPGAEGAAGTGHEGLAGVANYLVLYLSCVCNLCTLNYTTETTENKPPEAGLGHTHSAAPTT